MIEHSAGKNTFRIEFQLVATLAFHCILELSCQRVQFFRLDLIILSFLGCFKRSILIVREVGLNRMNLDAGIFVILGIIRERHHHTDRAKFG